MHIFFYLIGGAVIGTVSYISMTVSENGLPILRRPNRVWRLLNKWRALCSAVAGAVIFPSIASLDLPFYEKTALTGAFAILLMMAISDAIYGWVRGALLLSGLIYTGIMAVIFPDYGLDSVNGAAYGLAVYGGLYLSTRRKGIGPADPIVAIIIGLILGLRGSILASLAGSILALIYAGVFGLRFGLGAIRKKPIRMIPFMVAGAFLTLVAL